MTIKFLGTVVLIALLATSGSRAAALDSDPLPSWQGKNKEAIIKFVQAVTKEGGKDFVAPPARIATFDNDGTLWVEQPNYAQMLFIQDRARTLKPVMPEHTKDERFRNVLAGNFSAVVAGGEKAIAELAAFVTDGITPEDFDDLCKHWLASTIDPHFNRLHTETVYQPMLELLAYLRNNGFKTFIVTGGGIEFVRSFSEKVYGIPPEQVIGSSARLKLVYRNGKPTIVRMAMIDFIDDKAGKPIGIEKFIGRRPIAAFGNSDGDLQMLQWTDAGPGKHLCLFVHHTDSAREYAYDRTAKVGKLDLGLDEAAKHNWTVVDMKNDWKTVFPPLVK
jgi:hypothetical protein